MSGMYEKIFRFGAIKVIPTGSKPVLVAEVGRTTHKDSVFAFVDRPVSVLLENGKTLNVSVDYHTEGPKQPHADVRFFLHGPEKNPVQNEDNTETSLAPFKEGKKFKGEGFMIVHEAA